MLVPVLAVLLSVLASYNFKWWTAPVFTFITYVGFQLIADLYTFGVASLFGIIGANWLHITVLIIFATAIRFAVTNFEKRKTKIIYVTGMVFVLAMFDLIAQAQTMTFGELVDEELSPTLSEITILDERLREDIVIDDEETIHQILNDYSDMTLRSGVGARVSYRDAITIETLRRGGGSTRMWIGESGIRLSLNHVYRVEDHNELYDFLHEIMEEELE